MELAIITAKQVLQLFILILAGVIVEKAGIVRGDQKKMLSSLLINVTVPMMVFVSYLGGSEAALRNLGRSFIYSAVLFAVSIGVSLAVTVKTDRNRQGLVRFCCIFTNAAYMGFPLIKALFGAEGIMYASAFVTLFNVFLWTLGYLLFTDSVRPKDIVKNLLKSPPMYAVLFGLVFFIAGIDLPEMLTSPFTMIGDMTTPLSMMITGITIAETRAGGILKKPGMVFVILMRLVVIPVICLGVFRLLDFRGLVAIVPLIQEACPVAAISTMLAIQYDRDREFAAGAVMISTLLSVVTLPVYAYLLVFMGFV